MSAQAIIDELLEYFEGRADASMEPGEDRFRGNREMALLAEVKKLEVYISEEKILADCGMRLHRARRAVREHEERDDPDLDSYRVLLDEWTASEQQFFDLFDAALADNPSPGSSAVEQRFRKPQVEGSTPSPGTNHQEAPK